MTTENISLTTESNYQHKGNDSKNGVFVLNWIIEAIQVTD